MAHPYWVGSKGKYYPPRCVFEQLLDDGLIDAVELTGGSPTTEGNLLCVAKYADEAARGLRLAIVGGSDAHGVEEMGREFTVLLAPELSAPAVVRAIAGRNSVACDARMGPEPAVFGPRDLVEYVYFLLRVYFPMRDAERGETADPKARLTRLDALRNAFWAPD
jgi:hypothetical protein